MRDNGFRWQDHVISPRRTAADLIATTLAVLVAGAAVVTGPQHDRQCPKACRPVETASAFTEQVPSLAQLSRPLAFPREGNP